MRGRRRWPRGCGRGRRPPGRRSPPRPRGHRWDGWRTARGRGPCLFLPGLGGGHPGVVHGGVPPRSGRRLADLPPVGARQTGVAGQQPLQQRGARTHHADDHDRGHDRLVEDLGRDPTTAPTAAAAQAAQQGATPDPDAQIAQRGRPQGVEQHPQRLQERLGTEVSARRPLRADRSSRCSSNVSAAAMVTDSDYHSSSMADNYRLIENLVYRYASGSTGATWPGWPSCPGTAGSRRVPAWCSRARTRRGACTTVRPGSTRTTPPEPGRHHQRAGGRGRGGRVRARRSTTRCSSRPTSSRSSRSSPAATTTCSTSSTASGGSTPGRCSSTSPATEPPPAVRAVGTGSGWRWSPSPRTTGAAPARSATPPPSPLPAGQPVPPGGLCEMAGARAALLGGPVKTDWRRCLNQAVRPPSPGSLTT